MASSAEVLNSIERLPGVRYPVLVPNQKGLETLVQLMAKNEQQDMLITDVKDDSPHPAPTDEIAVFTAATDAFARANTNCTVAESLARLAPVVAEALRAGLRVRSAEARERCMPPLPLVLTVLLRSSRAMICAGVICGIETTGFAMARPGAARAPARPGSWRSGDLDDAAVLEQLGVRLA